jgi:hypothetical protein
MSAELVDPFAPPPGSMTQERYDDLKETAKARLLEDKGYMPKNFWHMFAALGARARGGDEFAAEVLEEVALADVGDDYDSCGGVL